jgi:hypothetical protein
MLYQLCSLNSVKLIDSNYVAKNRTSLFRHWKTDCVTLTAKRKIILSCNILFNSLYSGEIRTTLKLNGIAVYTEEKG